MKQLFLFKMISLMFIVYSGELLSQCNVQIPSWAFVVDSSGSDFTASNDTFWVCKGDTTNISGNYNVIYLEESAYIDVSGDNNKFYVKTGAYCEITGSYDSVYYENGALIANTGVGSNNELCASLIFDYSIAPANGCSDLGIADPPADDLVVVYPNPAKEEIKIEIGNAIQKMTGIQIIDYSGRRVFEVTNINDQQKIIDISDLESGVYVLQVWIEQQLITSKIIKE